jgi:O-antigen ligase/polysaccharide polymerase Wzy-like membrane protein
MHSRLSNRADLQVQGALQALVAGLVVSVALASSNIPVANIPFGRALRWVVLAELAVFALVYALSSGRRPRIATPASWFAFALVALALVSAAWSVDGPLTIGRGAALLILFATAFAIAHGAGGRERHVEQILLAILAAVTVVAVVGAIELFVRPDLARVPATTGSPLRFNGLGGNPNTMAMVVALGLPLAVWAAAATRARGARVTAVAVVLLLYASVVASGSRGALVAGLAGVLASALAAMPTLTRRRVAAVCGAVTALLLGGLGLMQVPTPASSNPVISNRIVPPVPVPFSPLEAQTELALENEIGYPTPGQPQRTRGLWDSSGRADAWRGAVRQAAQRPLLGYGFGTEERTFVDRYYFHYSDRVENAYLGTLLQLGVVGLLALLALLWSLLLGAWRAVRGSSGPRRSVAGAAAGVVVAGVVLAIGQSYLTSVGSPATAPFWLSAFLAATLAPRASRREEREGDEREEEPAQRQAEPRLHVMGSEHERVNGEQDDDTRGRTAAPQRER